MTAGPAKICWRCREDCSHRARVKDALGRYLCQACEVKLREAQRAAAPHPAAPASPEPAPIPPDDGTIPLADDPAGILAAASTGPRECPSCAMILGPDAVICTRCGLNTRTGRMLGTDKLAGSGRACIRCGYDLAGLKSPRCPECGALNAPDDRRRERDRRHARASVRNEYLKPVVMFGIGLTLSIAFAAAGGDGAGAAVWYLIKYAVYVPTGAALFFLCCLLWIGFDAPMHLTALRLAAVYAVTDAVAGLASFFWIIPIIPLAVVLLTYIGLLMDLLDLDLADAVLVAFVTFVVRWAAIMAITVYIMQQQ